MKTKLFLFLLCLCFQCFGSVIIIRDQLSPLEYHDDLYYLPHNFAISPGATNLFITMDGINKVCFLNTAPPGMFEQTSEINIVINGLKTEWNCFAYKTTVIEVRP